MNDEAGQRPRSEHDRPHATLDGIEQAGRAEQQTQRALGCDWGGYDLASPWDTGHEIVAVGRVRRPPATAVPAAEPESTGLPTLAALVTPRRVGEHGRQRVEYVARQLIERSAGAIEEGRPVDRRTLEYSLDERLRQRVRAVINATGSVLSPTLGGAPWSEGAITAARRAAGYADVDPDMDAASDVGARGVGAEDRLCALTGAEAALVVGSHAGAVLLALSTLADAGRIVVSRGDLVELDGGRRVADLLKLAGARTVPVGAVNRTTLDDVLARLGQAPDGGEPVGAIYCVQHPLRGGAIQGAPVEALTGRGVPVVVDHAIGALTDDATGRPTVPAAIAAGADAVCFAGDGRLGGPRCGIVVGQRAMVDRMRRHPLYAVLQVDKTLVAALEATLDDRLRGIALPVDVMEAHALDELRVVVEHWHAVLADRLMCRIVELEPGDDRSLADLPSVALAIDGPEPQALALALARGRPAVMGCWRDGALLLDARTVVPLGHGGRLLTAVERALEAVMGG